MKCEVAVRGLSETARGRCQSNLLRFDSKKSLGRNRFQGPYARHIDVDGSDFHFLSFSVFARASNETRLA